MAADQAVSPADSRALLWIGEASRLLLGFALLALLTRSVAPETLGTYLSVTSIVLLAPRLLDAGLPHALGYFLRVEPGSARSATLMLCKHIAIVMPLALGVAYCVKFVPFANHEATQIATDHWLPLALFIVSELTILFGLSTCIPTGRFKAYLIIAILPPLLFIACLAFWPGSGPTSGELLNILLATSLGGAMAAVATQVQAAYRHHGDARFPSAEAYAYGLRTYGSAVAKIAAQRFDRLFLVTLLGAAGYAQYSLAISVRDVAVFPANLHATTLRNRQIDLIARAGDTAGARRLLLRVSTVWLVLGVAGAVAAYTLWEPLVRWAFGARYLEAADFLKIVSFSCAPMAIMGFAWNHLYALKMPGRVTVITCLSLLVAVPTFAVCIRLQNPSTGVATAVVVWSALTALVSLAWAAASRPISPLPAHS